MITDGVTSVPDVAICETLLNQLRSGTVACSFVQVRTYKDGGEELWHLTKRDVACYFIARDNFPGKVKSIITCV